MKYACPKCGKKIEITTEHLIECQYRTVCPQCLTALQIVGDYAYVPLDDGSLDLTPEPKEEETVAQETAPQSEALPPVFTPPAAEKESVVVPPPFKGKPVAVQSRDPLFDQAVEYLHHCNAITPMMLRDRFAIPLERAQQLLLELEQAGFVGPYNGGGPRSILIPHNTNLPGYGQLQQSVGPTGATDGQQEQSQGKYYTIGCSGCWIWLLFMLLFFVLMRSC